MTNTTTTVKNITPGTDPAINGLIALQAWSSPITYAFPVNGSDYGTNYEGGLNTNNFQQISASQIIGAQFALDADVGPAASAGFSIEGFTMATISAGPGTTSTVRIGTSGALDFGEGFAFLPEDDPTAGDIWFHAPEVAQVGNYEWSTLLHEIGHAMGLEHAHEGDTVVPAQFDHHAYTIMSYRSFQGGSTEGGSTSGTFGFPQTFMMYDIAALQYMYGANYTINNTDTVYSWNPGSGDTLVNGSIGVDAVDPTIFATIWDGGGIDTYDLSAFSTNLTLNLTAGGNSLFNATQLADLGPGQVPDGNIYNSLLFEGNTNSLIENAIGGSGNDTITGNEVSNVLTGNGGNDILDGGAGIDYAAYNGVQANYTITSNANGSYTIVGDGTDTVTNVEFARFTDGDVALAPSTGGEINGTEGNDNPLNGTSGNDVINGLGGDDLIYGLGGNDTINGGDGRDILRGGDGDDTLNGDAGNDDFYGGAGADLFNGGEGADRVFYSTATAGVTANFINQSLNLGEAAGDTYNSIESVTGSNFDDVITSGNDDNDLVGLGGNDVLIGAGGRDRLFGGTGDDRLLGGFGNDDMHGQGGADTYVIQSGAGADRIFGYEVGVDLIEYNGGPGDLADLTIEQVGANTRITSIVGSLTLMGITASTVTVADFNFVNPLADPTGVTVTTDLTSGNDVFTGDENDNVVNGLAGNDTIRGGIGDDTLNGGDGNDLLTGGLGADVLNGGEGIDRVLYTAASTGVTINAINTALNTGEAAGDTYISIENFSGSNLDDNITSGNDGNQLIGLAGDDTLIGAGGNDTLFGGDGDDRLVGGADNDQLFGQAGADTFVFFASAGNDTIRDFEDGVDIIEFRDTVDSFSDLVITQSGANAVITSDNGVITLTGIDSALLDAADFTFV